MAEDWHAAALLFLGDILFGDSEVCKPKNTDGIIFRYSEERAACVYDPRPPLRGLIMHAKAPSEFAEAIDEIAWEWTLRRDAAELAGVGLPEQPLEKVSPLLTGEGAPEINNGEFLGVINGLILTWRLRRELAAIEKPIL